MDDKIVLFYNIIPGKCGSIPLSFTIFNNKNPINVMKVTNLNLNEVELYEGQNIVETLKISDEELEQMEILMDNTVQALAESDPTKGSYLEVVDLFFSKITPKQAFALLFHTFINDARERADRMGQANKLRELGNVLGIDKDIVEKLLANVSITKT